MYNIKHVAKVMKMNRRWSLCIFFAAIIVVSLLSFKLRILELMEQDEKVFVEFLDIRREIKDYSIAIAETNTYLQLNSLSEICNSMEVCKDFRNISESIKIKDKEGKLLAFITAVQSYTMDVKELYYSKKVERSDILEIENTYSQIHSVLNKVRYPKEKDIAKDLHHAIENEYGEVQQVDNEIIKLYYQFLKEHGEYEE